MHLFSLVHLFSRVNLQCMLDFWLRKYNEFIYFPLFFTLKGSVPNIMDISRAIFLHYYWENIQISQKNHALSTFHIPPNTFLGVHYHLRQKFLSVQLPNSVVWKEGIPNFRYRFLTYQTTMKSLFLPFW